MIAVRDSGVIGVLGSWSMCAVCVFVQCLQVRFLAQDAPLIWGKLLSSDAHKGKLLQKKVEWKILLLLSKIVTIANQLEFSHLDIAELDKCIWLHDTIWLGCPELQHTWKPKNHYLSHLPFEILRWGPLRGYWCEPFEHENQYTKGSVTHGNYANVLLSSAEGKALLVALQAMGGAGDIVGSRSEDAW